MSERKNQYLYFFRLFVILIVFRKTKNEIMKSVVIAALAKPPKIKRFQKSVVGGAATGNPRVLKFKIILRL